MDTGKGYFEPVKERQERELREKLEHTRRGQPAGDLHESGIFYEGQKIELNGSKFEVYRISKTQLTLKLLPKQPSGNPG